MAPVQFAQPSTSAITHPANVHTGSIQPAADTNQSARPVIATLPSSIRPVNNRGRNGTSQPARGRYLPY